MRNGAEQSSSRAADNNGNCLAGFATSDLKHPLMKDFYLQSHAAIQGSKLICFSWARFSVFPSLSRLLAARSSHYIVIEDEIFRGDIDK